MTNDPHAKDHLEQDLESVRSAWADQENIEPPDLLDRAVLNQARRALEKPGGFAGKWFSPRRVGALTTFAVIVLALTLVVQQENQAPIPAAAEMDGIKLDNDGGSADQDNRSMKAKTESAAREASPRPALRDQAILSEESPPAKRAAQHPAVSAPDNPPDPEAWIQELLLLQQAGDERLAAERAAFRAVYPDYPLPPELDN